MTCGFSLSSCGTQAPGHMGSVVCGTWALSLRGASSVAMAGGLMGLHDTQSCGVRDL